MMARFRFEQSAEYVHDGRVNRLVDKLAIGDEAGWLVKRLDTGETITKTQAELERAYANGTLVRHNDPGELTGTARSEHERRARKQYDDLSDVERERYRSRRAFLKYVAARIVPGAKTTEIKDAAPGEPKTVLQKLIRDAAAHAGLKKTPSVATYYRWIPHYDVGDTRGLVGRFSERGDRTQLHPLVRQTVMTAFQVKLDSATAAAGAGKFTRLRMKDVQPAVEKALDNLRLINPGPVFKAPSRATLYNWWGELPAVKRDAAKLGLVRARQAYRFTRGHVRPEHAGDEVEYDEADMPFFFVDEDTMMPLGRATLSWFLDVHSHSVVGFYVGFEPGGDLAMMSAAKHMCLPKAYVADEYPNIRNRYIQHGVPRMIRVDNSRAAWGRTAEDLCLRIDCDWDWCPANTPYFKPIVEGMFRIINEQLISALPSYVTSKLERIPDYDPAKNGVIGFRHFLYILHKWLIDYYHPIRQDWMGASPNERFVSGTAKIGPGLLDRATDVKMLFALVRDGRALDHKGILFESQPYGGDELQQLRLRMGHTQKVRIKVDASNIHNLWAWDQANEAWIMAVSREPEYTKGLSLHQHLLIRKHELKLYGTDGQHRHEAQAEIRKLIGNATADALSIQRNKLAARWDGIGTDNVFSNLDHDGRLGKMTGPFTGLPLNPLAPPQGNPAAQDTRRKHPPVVADSEPDRAASGKGAVTTVTPSSIRKRKSFAVDCSLGTIPTDSHERAP